jgi:hypothetical protein
MLFGTEAMLFGTEAMLFGTEAGVPSPIAQG